MNSCFGRSRFCLSWTMGSWSNMVDSRLVCDVGSRAQSCLTVCQESKNQQVRLCAASSWLEMSSAREYRVKLTLQLPYSRPDDSAFLDLHRRFRSRHLGVVDHVSSKCCDISSKRAVEFGASGELHLSKIPRCDVEKREVRLYRGRARIVDHVNKKIDEGTHGQMQGVPSESISASGHVHICSNHSLLYTNTVHI